MERLYELRFEEAKRLKPLSDNPEWKEFVEALKAAKSEPAFKEAIKEFKKKHSA